MSIQGLLSALEGLSGIHDEMLQLARDKTGIVIGNRVEELMALTSKEQRAVTRMEDQHRLIVKETASSWTEIGLPPRPVGKLSELIQAVHRADLKGALTEWATKLGGQQDELKTLNDRNQLLVKQSLEYIGFELDLITGPFDQEVTYSPSSVQPNYGGGSYRRVFDTRA